MTEESTRRAEEIKSLGPPPAEGAKFRGIIGVLSLIAALIGFGLLFFVEIPPTNEDALLLALGIILGWGSSVVSSEYGATTTGRKAADSAIRNMEK